jgi:hypothetical protein
MAKQLQLRRGTTAEHASFTGAVGEVTIDADKDTAVVHDAYQAGGFPLLREDLNNLANSVITANKLATNSGTYGQTLQVNDAGTAIEMGESGAISCQTFSASGTWTKPAGIRYVRVQLVGGGGGGGGHGESGGAGGYSEKIIDVRSISSVTVTIGGGGGGVAYHAAAGNGGASSFGSHLAGGGGYGAVRHFNHSGGGGGAGSGGNVNIHGGGGTGHNNAAGGSGGASYFGGCQLNTHHSYTNNAHTAHSAYGTGGSGAYTTYGNTQNGRNGFCIVWEYA